jgi:hypothetical protein
MTPTTILQQYYSSNDGDNSNSDDPVSLGFNENHPHTLLEFACRWIAVDVVRPLMGEGAKLTPGAVWCAIQGGNRELFEAMRTGLTSRLSGDDLLRTIIFAVRWWRTDALEWLLH